MDSPKVPMFKGKVAGRWHEFKDADHEQRLRESGEYEIEDFITVSALRSDEALGKIADELELRGWRLKADGGETCADLRFAVQAAVVEQVGGGQGE